MPDSPDRRARIESICDAALALPSDRRAAFLREACGNDDWLQADAESLLAYASRGGALDQPLGAMAARAFGGSASREASTVGAGTRFGDYEVVHLIDAGGMGQVYRARDTDLGRFVALKVLRPEVAADHDRLARLEHEARVLAALSHPNIAAIHGVVRGADRIALAMELVEGRTLAAAPGPRCAGRGRRQCHRPAAGRGPRGRARQGRRAPRPEAVQRDGE